MRGLVFLGAITLIALQISSDSHAQVKMRQTPPAWQTIVRTNGIDGKVSKKQQYRFECSYAKGNKLFQNAKKKALSSPTLILEAGQEGTVASASQSPYVTGVQKVGTAGDGTDAYQPLITVLDTGYSMKVTVTRLDEQHVQLDMTLESKTIDNVETVSIGELTTQSPTCSSTTQRVIRTVQLGEKHQLKMPAVGKQQGMIWEYCVKEI